MNKAGLTFMLAVLLFFITANYASAMGSKPSQSDISVQKETAAPSQNNQQMVRDVLDGMIEAYSARNTGKFMNFVSEDFGGDKTILERAVRKDFSMFTNIEIRYTFNNVTTDSNGKMISASIAFNRSHTVINTGNQAKSNGTSEFIFKMQNNSLKLIDMKKPPLFGLSGL